MVWKYQGVFVDWIVHKVDWMNQNNPNAILNKMASFIKRITKDILRESMDHTQPYTNTSWWNEKVKSIIKIKWDSYINLKKNNGVSYSVVILDQRAIAMSIQFR